MKALLFAVFAALVITTTGNAEESSALNFLKIGKTYRIIYANPVTSGGNRSIVSKKPSEVVTIVEAGGAQWFLVKYTIPHPAEAQDKDNWEQKVWINFAVIEKVMEMETPQK